MVERYRVVLIIEETWEVEAADPADAGTRARFGTGLHRPNGVPNNPTRIRRRAVSESVYPAGWGKPATAYAWENEGPVAVPGGNLEVARGD